MGEFNSKNKNNSPFILGAKEKIYKKDEKAKLCKHFDQINTNRLM